MNGTVRRGFTLVELLTVIAVIALLSAILLPVFGRARENARKTTCLSNMHTLYVAASVYKEDNGGYPCLLLGYAERPDGLPWTTGETRAVVSVDGIRHGFLYPAYVKRIEVFHCPDNLTNDRRKIVLGEFTKASPIFSQLQQQDQGHT